MERKSWMFTVAILLFSVVIIGRSIDSYAAINSLLYDSVCPDSNDGRHHMEGRSTCWAVNVNTDEERTGVGGQCKDCHMLIVTQNNLFLNSNQGMGWYSTRSAWGYVGNGFTIEVTAFYYNSSPNNSVGRSFLWE